MTRKISDASIAETVGVKGPTVAKIRKEKPEYQTDERIGSDGRIISRKRNPLKAVSNLSKKSASVEVASISSVADRPKTQGRDVVDDRHDLSGTRDENDTTLSTADAEEVSDFREQLDAPVEVASHAEMKDSQTTIGRDAVDDQHKILGTKRVTEATFSAADAEELRLFCEHFTEIRRLASPYLEEFMISYNVYIDHCDLRDFGKVMLDHIESLNQQVKQLKKQLEQANPVDPAKPAAELKAKPEPEPSAPEKANRWEEKLLAISPWFNPIIGRVREGMNEGWDWRFFSNNRAWKDAVNLVGKPLRNDAAALIQSLLKSGQQG
jgi:hypothetical protein